MTLAKEGNDRILLQVPGADNARVTEIKERIRKTAKMSFHEVVIAGAASAGTLYHGKPVRYWRDCTPAKRPPRLFAD